MKKKILSTLLALALTGVFLSGCGSSASGETTAAESEEISSEELTEASGGTLVVGYVDSGNSFPNEVLAVAIEQGFLEEELAAVGYSVETIPFTGAGPAINEAFVNGSIDIATVGDVPAIVGKSNGVDTILLAGEVHFNDAALAVPADSDIQSVEDLKGKTVATLQGSYMHKSLINMLEAYGMSISDIQFTNMTSADAASALEAGAVDAAVLANTQEATLANSDNVRIVLNCDDNPSWKGGHSLLVRTAYYEENHDATVAFIKAIKRANEYAIANRDTVLQTLTKSGGDIEIYEFLYPEEVNFNLSADDSTVEAYNDIKQFLLDNELIANDFDINDWIDKSIYEEAEIGE